MEFKALQMFHEIKHTVEALSVIDITCYITLHHAFLREHNTVQCIEIINCNRH